MLMKQLVPAGCLEICHDRSRTLLVTTAAMTGSVNLRRKRNTIRLGCSEAVLRLDHVGKTEQAIARLQPIGDCRDQLMSADVVQGKLLFQQHRLRGL